jgi:hypothetical protein
MTTIQMKLLVNIVGITHIVKGPGVWIQRRYQHEAWPVNSYSTMTDEALRRPEKITFTSDEYFKSAISARSVLLARANLTYGPMAHPSCNSRPTLTLEPRAYHNIRRQLHDFQVVFHHGLMKVSLGRWFVNWGDWQNCGTYVFWDDLFGMCVCWRSFQETPGFGLFSERLLGQMFKFITRPEFYLGACQCLPLQLLHSRKELLN